MSSSASAGSRGASSASKRSSTARAVGATGEAPTATQPSYFNPISKWEEPVEIPYLTLFDVHRNPREVNTDPGARVRMPLKVLSPEFHCPVCLGYMKKTMIVMECLHRFCGECIQKCLRIGKKECPSCRIHIPSRRSLRPDPNFDALIQHIYGDVDALEKHEEKLIETLNKAKNMNNADSESRKRGIMHQAMHRKKKSPQGKAMAGMKRKSPGAQSLSSQSSSASILGLEETPLINFVLRRHPQETMVERLDREYIRTAREATMKDLKIFLGKKLSYEPYTHFQILTVAGGKGVILDDSISLGQVQRDICDFAEGELILHFRIFPLY